MKVKLKQHPRGNPAPAKMWTKENHPKSPGRPRDPLNLATLRKFAKDDLANWINEISQMSFTQLEQVLQKPSDYPSLYGVIASVMRRCYLQGDFTDISKLIDRTIGPVPLRNEHSGPGGVPLPPPEVHYHPVSPVAPANA